MRKFNFYANFERIFMSKFTEKIFSLGSVCDACSFWNSFISRLARMVESILGAMTSWDLLLDSAELLQIETKKRIKMYAVMTTKRIKKDEWQSRNSLTDLIVFSDVALKI